MLTRESDWSKMDVLVQIDIGDYALILKNSKKKKKSNKVEWIRS